MVPLIAETWTWWAFVLLCVICRIISRVQTLGSVKRFQADDYITIAAMAFYTTLIVAINIVAHSDSNLLPPGFDVHSLSDQEIRARQYGSKLVLVVEQCQIMTVWAEKLCLLFLYQRLIVGVKEKLAIKILFGYVGVSWLVMEILYFGVWCRPFTMYWAVPTTQQCSAATNHLILNAVFNISSDVCILAVALPMFIKTQLPLRKKIAIVGIFSLGSFVIICAILNKVYSFNQPFGLDWTFWYVRESSTAILTANAAFVWALVRRMFKLRALGSLSGRSKYTPYNGYTATYTTTQTRVETSRRKLPRHEEIDLDLLTPDHSEFDGIHREIQIHVTEGSRSSMSTKKENDFMTGPSPCWSEAWAVGAPPMRPPGSSSSKEEGKTSQEGNSSNFGRSSTDSTTSIMTPQQPIRAVLRNSHGSPV